MADKNNLGLKAFMDSDTFQLIDGVYGDNFIVKVNSGINTSIQSSDTNRLIWELDSDFVFISTNTQFQVSSSSASDTTVVLFIEYVTDDYIPKTTQVTLNGQTNVALTPSDTFQINQVSVVAGAINVGDIYIHTNVSGQTAGVPNDLTETQAFIAVGIGVSRMSKFSSYKGYKTFVKSNLTSAALDTGSDTTITLNNMFRLESGIKLEFSKIHISTGGAIGFTSGGGSFAEKTTLFVEAISAKNNSSISHVIILYLIKDTFIDKLNQSLSNMSL